MPAPTDEEVDTFMRQLLGKPQKPGVGEDWSPKKRGQALYIVHTLANTPPEEWRSKRELHAALSEFRK